MISGTFDPRTFFFSCLPRLDWLHPQLRDGQETGQASVLKVNIDSVGITVSSKMFYFGRGQESGEIGGVCNLMLFRIAKIFSLKADNVVLKQSHQSPYVFPSVIDQEEISWYMWLTSFSQISQVMDCAAFQVSSLVQKPTYKERPSGNPVLHFNIEMILHSNILF